MENRAGGQTANLREEKKARRTRNFRTFRRVWAISGITLCFGFFVFEYFACRASGPAPGAMRSDGLVRVTRLSNYWLFEPAAQPARDAGLVFFPGSMVDPVAYAPLARSVAQAGHTVAIVPLPLRLAPLKRQKLAVAQTAADFIT